MVAAMLLRRADVILGLLSQANIQSKSSMSSLEPNAYPQQVLKEFLRKRQPAALHSEKPRFDVSTIVCLKNLLFLSGVTRIRIRIGPKRKTENVCGFFMAAIFYTFLIAVLSTIENSH
jgi:hypothetical protein